MSKHITDHDHDTSEAKLTEAFTKIERKDSPSKATKDAQRDARDRGENGRLRAFTRIEREGA